MNGNFSTLDNFSSFNDEQYSSKCEAIVYISDLPSNIDNDAYLENLIYNRLEKSFQITPISIRCYSKLGAGFICVCNNEIKSRLIQDIQKTVLDPTGDTSMITFSDTIELVSYIVIDRTNENKDINLPTSEEILHQWIQTYNIQKPLSCDQVSIQFPNIYRIISNSFDDLFHVMSKSNFSINNVFAHVYFGADCSFLEDLPKSITKEQLQEAISNSIDMQNISSSLLHIELNKQTNNACIIATDLARKWATKSFLYLDDKPISKKENLTCCLLLHPISDIHDNDTILKQTIFEGKATIIERYGHNLILEISDKQVFDNCLAIGVLHINGKPTLKMEIYTAFNNPEDHEIDVETWYHYEMIRYKPDIMQFVANLDHPIFRYKWNAEIWLQQYQNTKSQYRTININSRYRSNISSDQIRRLLQMTVMLNTIGIIRKKSYQINDQQITLNLNPKLITIVYNHKSLLEYGGSIPLNVIPYSKTEVKVINEDCVIIYEKYSKKYKKPLLLNMACATNPGGGYRKGDEAQEENLFRRSDYFRSLDIDLDHIQDEISERFYCSENGKILSLSNPKTMYPMDEYGAIYTSGLTFFRKSQDNGYDYMNTPLENVHVLAMSAYCNPKLDGNMLSPKYAIGMRKKIENIFSIAYYNKHDCLILSAFGCGTFKNPSNHIAKLFRSVIEQYAGFFQKIIFAISNDHHIEQQYNRQENFQSFKNELDELYLEPILPLNQPNTMFGPYRVLSDGLNISNVLIFDLEPCHFAATCNEIYDRQHSQNYSHPSLCKQQCLTGTCTQINDIVHRYLLIHRSPCKYGALCKDIDNDKHFQEYEHPSYCPNGGYCQDTSDDHEKAYRHLPLCNSFQKCLEYQKHIKSHCEQYRHCMPRCQYENHCVYFHNKKHYENYQHPFPKPCPFTPYHCRLHEQFIITKNKKLLSHDIHQHCLNFAHVCRFGRNCNDKDSLHWEKSIHVPRYLCSLSNKCDKLVQEDHLNSFTHPNIRDIRFLCKYADKCYARRDPKHLSKFRHIITFEDSGVVRYYNLNKDINFVENQKNNIERVINYINKENWEPLKLESIPHEIIDWISTVQPVHRCKSEILESILLHGHVMSRDYIEQLKKPIFVANSILQHSRLRRIKYLKEKKCAQDAREYVNALVTDEFEKHRFENTNINDIISKVEPLLPDIVISESRKQLIKNKEVILSSILSQDDMETIKTTSIEIAQASIKLHSNPAGLGNAPDQELGTNKNVFSILGPHLGHYYGDIFIVFKREILHHPDASFSIQAAITYALGQCFQWRPWLGNDSTLSNDRIRLFHNTKLHASVTGYEYATALELIATTSETLKKKSMNIDLKTILHRWINVDSHMNIEARLPQLIPLDYIDHIYMTQNTFDSLSLYARKSIDTIFKNRITKTSHEIELNPIDKEIGPKPNSKAREEYQNFVIQDLIDKFGQRDIHSIIRPIQGSVITIPSINFNDHFVLPLTISQAYEQYQIDHSNVSNNITVYIYWQVMNGDMMLTLSNKQIDTGESQPDLNCLICYIAEKPSTNDIHYHEYVSYLHSGRPFQHEIILAERRYTAKSTSFYLGCNTDDFMTFCLEIQRSTGKVILSHAGPNSIYNHEKISCTFSKVDLDLNQLNFIHVSAGTRTVPIRNLIVTFEKLLDLDPAFDKNFKKVSFLSTTSISTNIQDDIDNNVSSFDTSNNKDEKSVGFVNQVKDKIIQVKDQVMNFFVGDHSLSLIPCPDNINCLIQYSEQGPTHNSKFSHPCRFAELCRNQEPHLIHESRQVSKCILDRHCSDLCDPFHRAQYRHTDLPYFLIPCRDQENCQDRSDEHRIKYSHGERVLETLTITVTKASSQSEQSLQQTTAYKHVHEDSVTQQQNDDHILSKWEIQCHDQINAHAMKYYDSSL
ncbi:unnamed protein product [Rotaria sp. Silwood2]|nr:unnamed protein product [Rotaria sp. Silwood2]